MRGFFAFLILVLFLPGASAQSPHYVSVRLSPDAKANKARLGPQWSALDARTEAGVDFVLRQRIPEHPKRILVYLDGGGSVGHDNNNQLRYPKMIALFESEAFADTVVILPQCPVSMAWDSFRWDRSDGPYAGDEPSPLGEALIGLVHQLQETYHIERQRTLVWGISHGAFGLLDMVTWHPEVFGSFVSLAGGGDPGRLASTPSGTDIWLFHGTQDSNVPPLHSQRLSDALTKQGLSHRLTLIPGANHGIMDLVLADTSFISYLTDWARN